MESATARATAPTPSRARSGPYWEQSRGRLRRNNAISTRYGAISSTRLTHQTADGETTAITTEGAHMGFTLAPKQINDAYNIVVHKK